MIKHIFCRHKIRLNKLFDNTLYFLAGVRWSNSWHFSSPLQIFIKIGKQFQEQKSVRQRGKNIVPELSVEVQEVMMIVIFLSLCISFALVSFTITFNENLKIKGCHIKIAKRTSPLYNPPVYFFLMKLLNF